VSRFLALLHERPVRGVTGVLWFRLGHRGDPDAWSLPTPLSSDCFGGAG
jgi:hypothetical protein